MVAEDERKKPVEPGCCTPRAAVMPATTVVKPVAIPSTGGAPIAITSRPSPPSPASATAESGNGCTDLGTAAACDSAIVSCIKSLAVNVSGRSPVRLRSCYCKNGLEYLQCYSSSLTAHCPSSTMTVDFAVYQVSWFEYMCGSVPATAMAQITPPSVVDLSVVPVRTTRLSSRSTPPARTGTPAYSGTGPLLAGACAAPSYTLVDARSTVYWAGLVGCSNDRPECCPWPAGAPAPGAGARSNTGIAYPSPKDASQLTLTRCPDDYYSVSGSCCPTGYFPFTRAVAGQTPCWSSVDRATPVPTLVANVAGQPTDTTKPTVAIVGVVWAVQYPVDPQHQPDSGLAPGAIAAITIGAVAILLGACIAWFIWRIRRAPTRQGLQLQDPGIAMAVFKPEKRLKSNTIGTTGSSSLSSMPPLATPPVSRQRYEEQLTTRPNSFQPPPPTARAYVEEDMYHSLLSSGRVTTSPTPPPRDWSSSEPTLDQREVHALDVLPSGADGRTGRLPAPPPRPRPTPEPQGDNQRGGDRIDGGANRLPATAAPPPRPPRSPEPQRDWERGGSLDVGVGGDRNNPVTPTPPPQIWQASQPSPYEQNYYGPDDIGRGNRIDHRSTGGRALLPGASLAGGKSRSVSPMPGVTALPPRLGPPPSGPLPPIPAPSPRPKLAPFPKVAGGKAGTATPPGNSAGEMPAKKCQQRKTQPQRQPHQSQGQQEPQQLQPQQQAHQQQQPPPPPQQSHPRAHPQQQALLTPQRHLHYQQLQTHYTPPEPGPQARQRQQLLVYSPRGYPPPI